MLAAFAVFMVIPPIMFSVVNLGERLIIPVFAGLLMWTRIPRAHLVAMMAIALLCTGFNLKFMYDTRHIASGAGTVADAAADSSRTSSPVNVEPVAGASEVITNVHANTRHKYLNHHVFQVVEYYEAIERSQWCLPVWGTGMMVNRGVARDGAGPCD